MTDQELKDMTERRVQLQRQVDEIDQKIKDAGRTNDAVDLMMRAAMLQGASRAMKK